MLNAEQYIDYMVEAGEIKLDKLLSSWDGVTNTSWADVAFGGGNMQKHNISFTNGNERGNYYLSLSYMNNNGIVRGDADSYKASDGGDQRRVRDQELVEGGHHQPDREVRRAQRIVEQRVRQPSGRHADARPDNAQHLHL